MPSLKRIHLQEIDSTNIYIKKVEATNVVVTAEHQTAGRGQGTNKWESEEGMNLTFSIKVSPHNLMAKSYFLISMTVALAIREALSAITTELTLKWPNDIYWKDRKLSGTLIETSISGKQLQNCIIGIGININQKKFLSDAPNPVSLWQITGQDYDREAVLEDIIKCFNTFYEMLLEGRTDELIASYHKHLYRKEGFYEYEDANGVFKAEIKEVRENGHIVLSDENHKEREYEFKEVKFRI